MQLCSGSYSNPAKLEQLEIVWDHLVGLFKFQIEIFLVFFASVRNAIDYTGYKFHEMKSMSRSLFQHTM